MRRRHLLAASLALPAYAQSWAPSRPVTLVLPTGAGGTTDIAARMLADALAPRLGVPVLVENRAAGNGVVAAQAVLRAPRDGHTLLISYSGFLTATPALTPDLPYDPARDLVAVAPLMDTPHAMIVHPSVPARTLPELAACAQANPGFDYASSGIGSVQHIGAALWRLRAGVPPMTAVHYRTVTAGITDLLAGRVKLFVTTIPPVAQFIRDGQLRAIVLTDPERSTALPDLPTAAGGGMPGLEVSTWNAVMAAAGTPAPVVERLRTEVMAFLAQPAIQQRMSGMGSKPGSGDVMARMAREYAETVVVVREGGICAE
jgi:tripartite-type tricarboxylate transporter receptor subunit TctC